MGNSPDRLRCVDLLSMDGKDSTSFAEKVARTRGIIPVYVHPYCIDENPIFKGRKTTAYKIRRDAEIATFLVKNAPIVIFEENRPTKPLLTRVKGTTEGNLYVVPGTSDILTSIEEVKDVLRNAMVNEINIGGVFSNLCVAVAEDGLTARGFRVNRTLSLY